ncbi:zinc ABC transporter substrate-binding protein [Candidatus Bathyarchaeota archaeon]|nr:zinc ABC transporter substrate-binding protein [Candidatus Bathyarchaeota archaeon]
MNVKRTSLLGPGTLAILLLLLFAATACRSGGAGEAVVPSDGDPIASLEPAHLGAGEKLAVVATTNIVGDVIRQVGGDRIELVTLMGIGVDPHSYVPTPSDVAAIYDAHVVFLNGGGLEDGLENLLDSAGGAGYRVEISEGIQFLTAQDEARAGAAAADDHGALDPHVWFSVPNVIRWVENARQALSRLDPGNADVYEANAQRYTRELEDLDVWIQAQIGTIPAANRKLVTNHASFGYLAERYGLEQVGAIYPFNPSADPSARTIAALQDTVQSYGVQAIFTESTVNTKLAQQMALDTGVRLVPLYTGSLGGPGSGAETYVGLMRYDVEAIVEALR